MAASAQYFGILSISHLSSIKLCKYVVNNKYLVYNYYKLQHSYHFQYVSGKTVLKFCIFYISSRT